MSALRRYHPLPFAPAGAFVWARTRTVGGVEVRPGDPVDKSAFTPMRLRQLYDARMIAPAQEKGFAGDNPPEFLKPDEGLADKLAAENDAAEAAERDAEARRKAEEEAARQAAAESPTNAVGRASRPPRQKKAPSGAKRVTSRAKPAGLSL